MRRIEFPALLAIFAAAVSADDVKNGAAAEAASPPAAEKPAWHEDFTFPTDKKNGRKIIPANWELKTKVGTKSAEFRIEKNQNNGDSDFLRMESDSASASLTSNPGKIDIKNNPVLRWRWRVSVLPAGADGKDGNKDDQAIGIYVGTGGLLDKKSVSYRWDTETPKNSKGECKYGGGTIKVKWFTLRTKEDPAGEWFVEERNVLEDFRDAWGFEPEDIYVSISCNSQYTGTKASADLDWIEFAKSPADTPKGKK